MHWPVFGVKRVKFRIQNRCFLTQKKSLLVNFNPIALISAQPRLYIGNSEKHPEGGIAGANGTNNGKYPNLVSKV
jgi:hypothetical protein